jgi:hypothetical protein
VDGCNGQAEPVHEAAKVVGLPPIPAGVNEDLHAVELRLGGQGKDAIEAVRIQ